VLNGSDARIVIEQDDHCTGDNRTGGIVDNSLNLAARVLPQQGDCEKWNQSEKSTPRLTNHGPVPPWAKPLSRNEWQQYIKTGKRVKGGSVGGLTTTFF
jgi:hypothetical protein